MPSFRVNASPTLRRIIRGKVNEQHANCRDFPLPSGAAAGLLLAFIEQLIDGSMHYSPVYLLKTTDIRLCVSSAFMSLRFSSWHSVSSLSTLSDIMGKKI